MVFTEIEYPHLYLIRWPFQETPDEESCKIWADMERSKKSFQNLFDIAARRRKSRLNIVWAWYGTGKSHSLMHFEWFYNNIEKNRKIYAIYSEFPEDAKRFIDIYYAFYEKLDLDLVEQKAIEVFRFLEKEFGKKKGFTYFTSKIAKNWKDFATAIHILVHGKDEDKRIARDWFDVSTKSPLKELKKRGIRKRIEKERDVIKAMSNLVRLLTFNSTKLKTYYAIVWMIDEFNRLDLIPRADYKNRIRSCFRTLFNFTPEGLCLIFACSLNTLDSVYGMIGPSLKNVLSRSSPPVKIEAMTFEDAEKFMVDLLSQLRPKKLKPPSIHFPFTPKAISRITKQILDENKELTPRNVFEYHEFILNKAEGMIQTGEINIIDENFVEKAFLVSQNEC